MPIQVNLEKGSQIETPAANTDTAKQKQREKLHKFQGEKNSVLNKISITYVYYW